MVDGTMGQDRSGKIEHFTDLEIWRKSHMLFLDVIRLVDKFPNGKGADTIARQMIRSCGSIGANIAEGFNRSRKYFLSYLDIAKGSCYETENWLYKARDTRLMSGEEASSCLGQVVEINKMIHSLINKISMR